MLETAELLVMPKYQLPAFPAKLLVPAGGTISGADEDYSITIVLKPFSYEGEKVKQTLEIENVLLPAERIAELANKTFKFPANPEVGYVESSIYLWSVHNPIDVSRVKFGAIRGKKLDAEIKMRFVFEYEGCCRNLNTVLIVPLRINYCQLRG